MFRVAAASIEEYFGFDPAREADLRRTDESIRAAAPTLARWFVPGTAAGKPGMAMTLIGYGSFEYALQRSPITVTWPIVGLALQKNYLSLYFSAEYNGSPFALGYTDQLGEVDISSTGAVRFARATDLNPAGLATLLTDLEHGLTTATVRVRYGRNTTTVAVHGYPSTR
ncbi:hypothetical protein ABZ942_32765 [Nocardia sp. NPDC046473]|uniref:hypothetical protein n=1 Tax=Nocardia sp. NPDC046473 TaxID=3155733 RepID=UPI0033D1ABDE